MGQEVLKIHGEQLPYHKFSRVIYLEVDMNTMSYREVGMQVAALREISQQAVLVHATNLAANGVSRHRVLKGPGAESASLILEHTRAIPMLVQEIHKVGLIAAQFLYDPIEDYAKQAFSTICALLELGTVPILSPSGVTMNSERIKRTEELLSADFPRVLNTHTSYLYNAPVEILK